MIQQNFKTHLHPKRDYYIKDFIEYRVNSSNYRGQHLFQHNRLRLKKIEAIYDAFNEVGKDFIEIPRGDEVKDYSMKDFPDYDLFVGNFLKKTGSGTSMSIKKNLFPDLARLRIINRYDAYKNYLDPSSKGNTHFFSLNENFEAEMRDKICPRDFISYTNRQIRISHSIFIEKVFEILLELNNLSISEIMYFVTWIDLPLPSGKKTDTSVVINLIKEYRGLSRSQRWQLDSDIKSFANPKKWDRKKDKKDFNNWRNEAQQILDILKDFALFEPDAYDPKSKICIKAEVKKTTIKFKRNVDTKNKYFREHKVSKDPVFELDHIVPFGLITNQEDYMLIENWQNLIYIDSNTHRKKTYSGNRFMILKKLSEINLKMESIDNKTLDLVNNRNALFDQNLIQKLIEYNQKLRKQLNI